MKGFKNKENYLQKAKNIIKYSALGYEYDYN